ncbi:hypothetical protein DL766_009665 [Monosporascus sp. MC13-8B]|uniref:Uncharacterized protein n=1 Tax=Monosporascus cannonballus TaxID=155416 RepID=A0ABY0H642_9PEZI|nr:hypothetical protein DL763_009331 [Monosporascus cannonballus]RYO84950.1 hypothetical protein DL762_005415 [Monosporascus cannonballus]RYP14475.1 hypothetical protein DL766_009665 [Monosporascus sp. MC13-8B]
MAIEQFTPHCQPQFNGDAGYVQSYPARPDDDKGIFGARRARLPRSKSTSNMLDAVNAPPRTTKDEPRDAAGERLDRDNLRALAEFLRTTAPPYGPALPQDDECFGLTDSRANRKLIPQSLWRGRRTRSRAQSLQTQLPKNAIPGTTTAGHRHIAISTPDLDGGHDSWFRSQYPVLPPGASAAGVVNSNDWLGRTSSRGALSSDGQSQNSVAHLRKSSSISSISSFMSSLSGGAKYEMNVFSLSAVRPSTTRPALKPVEECRETYQDGQYVTRSSMAPDTADEQSHPQSSPIHSKRSQSAQSSNTDFSSEQPMARFEFPAIATTNRRHEPNPSPTPPMSLHHRRQLSRMSKSSPDSGSLGPPDNFPKQPADLVVKPALTVPGAKVIPESPGFPNMLAEMTFPSPPMTSRPSTRAENVGFPTPSGAASPVMPPLPSQAPTSPFSQSRTASKRACANTFASSTSLNEVVMLRKQPTIQHAEAGNQPRTPDVPGSPLSTSSWLDVRALKEGFEPQVGARQAHKPTKDDPTVGGRSDDSIATAKAQDPESSGPYITQEIRARGQSTSSSATETTDKYCLSATTSNSTQLSNRSDVTTTTSIMAKDTLWSPVSPSNRESSAPICLLPIMGAEKAQSAGSPTLSKAESVVEETIPSLEMSSASSTRRESLASPNTPTSATSMESQDDDGLQSPSITAQRTARKAKVHEYKQRDVNAVRISTCLSGPPRRISQDASMDSPVLGWFPQELARRHSKQLSLQHHSPLAQRALRLLPDSSTGSTLENAQSEQGLQAPNEGSTAWPAKQGDDIAAVTAVSQSLTKSSSWAISSIMVSATISEEALVTPSKNELIISPVMEVVNINPFSEPKKESKPKPLSQHLSTLLLLESSAPPQQTPRASLSLRPQLTGRTHSKSHSRSKPAPITITRNPKTGALERTITAPKTIHTLVPMPPTSSDPPSSRRWSLPVRPFSSVYPRRSWERTPSLLAAPRTAPQAEQAKDVEQAEEEESERDPAQESQRRREIIKERLRRQKEEKDREIANIVARTVASTPTEIYDDEDQSPEKPDENDGLQDIERRLQRLQRNGDAWLRVMGPLLENMSKTLEAMRPGGRVSSSSDLRMSEFSIDMEAEARRFSLVNQRAPSMKQSAARQAPSTRNRSPKQQQSPSPGAGGDDKEKRIGRGRSSSKLGRLHQQLDKLTRTSEEGAKEKEAVKGDGGLLAPPPSQAISALPATPRTLQEHEFEVQMAIRRRIKKQEEEFDALMDRWGVTSSRSRRGSVSSAANHNNDNSRPEAESLREGPPKSARAMDDSDAEALMDPALREMRRKTRARDAGLEVPSGEGRRRSRSNSDLGAGSGGGREM